MLGAMKLRDKVRQWLGLSDLATRKDVAALLGEIKALRGQHEVLHASEVEYIKVVDERVSVSREIIEAKLDNLCTLIQMAQLTRPSPVITTYDWDTVQQMQLEELIRNPKEEN